MKLGLPPSPRASTDAHLDYASHVERILRDELRRLETPGMWLQASWPLDRDGVPHSITMMLGLCRDCTAVHRALSLLQQDGDEPSDALAAEVALALATRGWSAA